MSLCLGGLILSVTLCLCGAAVAGAQTIAWPVERPPRPLPAHDVAFPPYQVQKLANGLQVVVVLHHEQPVVSMRLLVRAGSAADPRGKLGLARLGAGLLDQGTTTKSAQQLADEVDFIGGQESTGAGTDLSYLNMIVMKDSFDVGMRMLSDMTRHPAFAQAEIDRQKQQLLSGLRVQQDDPSYIADAVFDRLVYGFHPYGLPGEGTPETIAGITRDDLVEFHRKYFAPNNAILAVVGDVTADEAIAEAKQVFGDWQPHDVPVDHFVTPPDSARRLIIVNKPDAVQTEVRVGHIGIARNHPDYMAVNLAIRILGGEGSNRLHQVLRTERGLTYGAQADMDALKESGDFEAQTNTRSEATGEVLRLIVDQFWRLQRERVSEIELADAKAYMTGSFPLTIETPDAIAMQVLNVIFYDLPLDQLQTFRERVNAVTVDDIQRAAQQYLKPDRLSVVLVGNAAAFASQLKGVGFGTFETVDLPDLDLTSANFKHERAADAKPPAGLVVRHARHQPLFPSRPEPVAGRAPAYAPVSQQSTIAAQDGPQARALLDAVVAAKGGLDRLRAIKTIVATTKTTTNTPTGPIEAEQTTYMQYPNHVRVETTVPDGTIVNVYDGEHAWVRDPRGLHEVPPQMIPQLTASLKRDTVALLLAAEDGSVRARALPDVKQPDGAVAHALEFSGNGLEPMVVYVNPATNLIEKQTYFAGGPGQPLVEELFSDYRDVDGVKVAFAAALRQGGRQVLDRRITDIKINPPIDPALFKRPAS